MSVFQSSGLRLVLPTLIILGVLRLVFWMMTFPNPDEAYYWLWGQHPALSYYDHPPLQAWGQGLITVLLGQSFFTLRLSNVVSNGLIVLTYYRISKYLYGERGTDSFWVTIAVLFTSPLYFLFLALAWHDHWLITFSLIAAFQFIQFLDGYEQDGRGQSWRLYGAAIALGGALLCKYNAVLMGAGFLVAIATHPTGRKLFRDPRLYGAIALTLVMLLPIVVWNASNDWQSWQYYRDRSVDQTLRLKWGDTLTFIGVSLLTVSPIYLGLMMRQWWQFWRSPASPLRDRQTLYYHVAFWCFTISTGVLLIVALLSTALYYWNILAYLLLVPLLPPLLLRSPDGQRIRPRFAIAQGYGILFATLLVVHYSIFPLSALAGAEGDPDSRMLYGWEQVGAAVQAEKQGLNQPFLVTTDYRSASALAYQLGRADVLAISDRIDQFDFWFDPQALQGRDAVILSDDWHPLQPALSQQFQRLSEPQSVTVRRWGVFIKTYYLVRGYTFQFRSP